MKKVVIGIIIFLMCIISVNATEVMVSDYGYNYITLSFDLNYSNYEVYRLDNYSNYNLLVDTDNTSYKSDHLKFNKTYFFKIMPYNINNNIKKYGKEEIISFKTKLNKVNAKVIPYKSNILKITYDKVLGSTGYQIYESSDGKTYRLKISTDKLFYIAKNLKQNKKYYYKIRSYKVYKGEKYYSSFSYISSRTIGYVTSFKPSNNAYKEVKISITPVKYVNGYRIYRSTKYNGTYSYIGSSDSNIYIDKTVSPNKKYYYKIIAYRLINSVRYNSVSSSYKVITTRKSIISDYPTFVVSYSNEQVESLDLTVITDASNLISFNNSEFKSINTITLDKNVNNYSIRVKNEKGLIKERKINITNIISKSIKEQNDDIISNIYYKYGFLVDYGEDTYFYYGQEPCRVLVDEEKANKALKDLEKIVEEFPTDFFRTFISKTGYRVTLFDDIPGDVAGLASYEIGDDNQMIIDVNTGFVGRIFYHETWHIMESLIRYVDYGKPDVFSNWNSLNPSGFTYSSSSINANNDYTSFDYMFENNMLTWNRDSKDISFITEYAKTSAYEDRAELFADLMFRPYKKEYMYSSFGINKKALELINIIDKYFVNTENAKWKRWVSFN